MFLKDCYNLNLYFSLFVLVVNAVNVSLIKLCSLCSICLGSLVFVQLM